MLILQINLWDTAFTDIFATDNSQNRINDEDIHVSIDIRCCYVFAIYILRITESIC